MTHEKARFVLTLLGFILPIPSTFLSIFLVGNNEAGAVIVVLVLLVSAFMVAVSHIVLMLLTISWKCGVCGKRYFHFFMPYWPFVRSCQNCGCVD